MSKTTSRTAGPLPARPRFPLPLSAEQLAALWHNVGGPYPRTFDCRCVVRPLVAK